MDTKLDNYTRFKNYDLWENRKNIPYNYERDGLLNKIMSKVIVETKNKPLRVIMAFYERSMIFLMKYTDYLRNFKNPHWKNR